MNKHYILPALFVATVFTTISSPAQAQRLTGGSRSARSLIPNRIDRTRLVSLSGHVPKALTADRDLGPVEDETPIPLFLMLKHSPEQQADLDALLTAQQDPGSPSYHKWLTPQEFGERFGASESDISKLTFWLQSEGFQVTSVLNNASTISFNGTAAAVRNTFHTQLHY